MVTTMRIISRRVLHEFANHYPQAQQPLDQWYRYVQAADWHTPADMKQSFRSADILPNQRVVFNISGNHFRLVVKIEYDPQIVYIRFVGTHAAYDRIDAATI
jgi:mRNA interferase HigB